MEKSKIEWCDSTWNPLSGCYHKCEYCYARRTANRFKGCDSAPDGETDKEIVVLDERLTVTTKSGNVEQAKYPFGFTPTFHRYRLGDLQTKRYGKNIFVCSMADLFGDWVPDEIIEEVFDACIKAPDHRYLFLTKNPNRYYELGIKGKLPEYENFWYGSTATNPETPYFHSERHNCFLSIEPMHAPFEPDDESAENIRNVDWFIFGAETGNRKDKIVPERSWLEGAVEQMHTLGKKVFMKDSLKDIWGEDLIAEFPWD